MHAYSSSYYRNLAHAYIYRSKRSAKLPGHRNKPAYILRLPPEIMSTIFCASLPYPGQANPFPKMYGFMGVCRCWREIALDTAALWTVVPRATPELTQMFLSRSKSAPLVISVTPHYKAIPDAALRHLHRAQTLFLQHDRTDTEHLSHEAPMLVECEIRNLFASMTLPDNFLGLYAPQLRRLNLYGLSFKWQMLYHPSLVGRLTDLELEPRNECYPRGEELAAALNAMPHLQRLAISSNEGYIFASTASTLR